MPGFVMYTVEDVIDALITAIEDGTSLKMTLDTLIPSNDPAAELDQAFFITGGGRDSGVFQNAGGNNTNGRIEADQQPTVTVIRRRAGQGYIERAEYLLSLSDIDAVVSAVYTKWGGGSPCPGAAAPNVQALHATSWRYPYAYRGQPDWIAIDVTFSLQHKMAQVSTA